MSDSWARALTVASIAVAMLANCPQLASASPFRIDFALTSGDALPTFGAFDYTPGTGFSFFTVVWHDVTFDLMENEPNTDFVGCLPAPQTNGAPLFALMSQECSPDSTYEWWAIPGGLPGSTQFVFRELPSGLGFGLDKITDQQFDPALGTWTITAVPEPGSLLLLGFGVAGVSVVRQRRRLHSR